MWSLLWNTWPPFDLVLASGLASEAEEPVSEPPDRNPVASGPVHRAGTFPPAAAGPVDCEFATWYKLTSHF